VNKFRSFILTFGVFGFHFLHAHVFCLIFMSPSNMYNQVQIKEEPRQWPKVLILTYTLQIVVFTFNLS
jgi:hypothetical protein